MAKRQRWRGVRADRQKCSMLEFVVLHLRAAICSSLYDREG